MLRDWDRNFDTILASEKGSKRIHSERKSKAKFPEMEDLLHLYSGGTGISLDHVSDIDMGEDTASDVIVEEDWATLFTPAQSIECDGGTGGSWKPDTSTRSLQAISDLAQSTSSIMSSAPHGRQA